MVTFATQVKRRRGTAEQNDEFTGAEGEIVVNLTDKSLRVHDGYTKGGFETMRRDMENSVNISNCILEIPQDIKLELTDGTLTLKAGSKVYVPNGFESDGVTPKFDEITIESDITIRAGNNDARLLFLQTTGGLDFMPLSLCYSGATAPTGNQYMLWYDTANNLMKQTINSGTSWTVVSLPIARVTTGAGVVASISRTFNGFGYIGSTVFGLKGVKVLVPNGKNPDGTNNNYIYTFSTVITRQVSGTGNSIGLTVNTNGNTFGAGDYSYSAANNTVSGSSGVLSGRVMIGRITYTNSVISSIETKRVYQALDYNDTEHIAHQAMPSSKQLDYTLGATGATYQAPADGYVYFAKIGTAAGQTIQINQGGLIAFQQCTNENKYMRIFMPVRKGGFSVSYTAAGGDLGFRFVYANGTI